MALPRSCRWNLRKFFAVTLGAISLETFAAEEGNNDDGGDNEEDEGVRRRRR